MDPRDRDFEWTEHYVGMTISETVAPNVYPVWRWRLRSGANIVDQRGFWRWLRPLVKAKSLAELLEETVARVRENNDNKLFSTLVERAK
jgi:hypothetical protein